MGDYTNQKPNVSGSSGHQIIQGNIDVNSLAEQLAKLLSLKGLGGLAGQNESDFSDVSSLEKLAKSMILQRGDKTSNFDGLGEVKIGKQTKEDQKDVQDTIDLLNKLE